MQLTILDHHNNVDFSLIENPKVEITFGNETEDYFQNVKERVNRVYDKVLFEQNIDAVISTIVYYLNINKNPDIECIYSHIPNDKFRSFSEKKKNDILALNTLRIYGSELDNIDKIFIINPHETGLANISISQILYKSINNPSPFIRDLVGLAIAADYTMEEAMETILEIIRDYKSFFPELYKRTQDLSLNKFNLLDSKFGELTRMIWAPVILEGEDGAIQLIANILESGEFRYTDLYESSEILAARYIKNKYQQFKDILTKEKNRFQESKIEDGIFISYEPEYKSENFIREFSNIIKDENLFNIIMMKVKKDDGSTKYSIRRGKLDVDIGGILYEMGTGGGNPYAGGGTVQNEVKFEEEFKKMVKNVMPT